MPTFFTIRHTFYKRHAPGIVKDELRCLKVDTVFLQVNFVFGTIPFDPQRVFTIL